MFLKFHSVWVQTHPLHFNFFIYLFYHFLLIPSCDCQRLLLLFQSHLLHSNCISDFRYVLIWSMSFPFDMRITSRHWHPFAFCHSRTVVVSKYRENRRRLIDSRYYENHSCFQNCINLFSLLRNCESSDPPSLSLSLSLSSNYKVGILKKKIQEVNRKWTILQGSKILLTHVFL